MRKSLSNYCALPFVHLAVEGNGDLKACCQAPSYLDNEGNVFNLNTHKLEDIYATNDYKQFVDDFKNNRRSNKCKSCWKQEEQGLSSLRQNFSRQFQYLDDESEGLKPSFIEIKMGNKCNLMCAICNPDNSTNWVRELKRRDPDFNGDKINNNAAFVEKQEIWNNNTILKAKEFHLMGGEPFAIKQTEELIDLLISKGNPSDTKIWFNTNGSYYPESLIEKIKVFKKVHISVSLDDIGPRMEYQRYPANFGRCLDNMAKMAMHKSSRFSVIVDICWSLFNVYYFSEIIEFYDDFMVNKMGYDVSYLDTCRHFYSGRYYTLNNLSDEEKVPFRESLQKSKSQLGPRFFPLIDELQSWLNSPQVDPDICYERKKEIFLLDQKRKQKFHDVFPELDQFMNQSSFQL